MSVLCEFHSFCSGCSNWTTNFKEQILQKTKTYQSLTQEFHQKEIPLQVEILSETGLRDRMDFVMDHEKMGLYSHQTKRIEDLPKCLMLSNELSIFYSEFRQISWPPLKGSFRLRVSPTGQKGAWLDFSNLDIKKLLQEKTSLLSLLKICSVEIGQKRKRLVLLKNSNDQTPQRSELDLKLKDPEPELWTRTWSSDYKSYPLYSCIGSFSQVGDRANQRILKSLHQLTSPLNFKHFLEYGSGNGNLTFALLNSHRKATLLESDPLSILSFQKSAELLGLKNNFSFVSERELHSNYFKENPLDLILANPPRSGLTTFLNCLSSIQNLPTDFIYMSCYPRSLFEDLKILNTFGYTLEKSILIDQFPQTDHFELMVHLKK